MSELIAEARVLVTPDVTTFRPLLISGLATATRGVTVPVSVVPTVSTAALSAVTAQQMAGATAARATASALQEETKARRASAKAAAEHHRQLSQLSRGAGGAALSLVGLRGATLAATGPFLAGAAAFAVFAKSVGTAAGLERSLNTFRVTADATAEDMERISQVARDLGTDLTLPGVTAGSAAEALAQLSRAGLSVEDSVAGVRGTLQLATAAAIDNEQAVLLTAGALNAFSLAGEEAARIADLLAASSKESQGSIVDVGLALQQSAAAAAQAGVSVEDTIALLTQLGRAGLRGSDAGTSLRVALLRLINPSKQAREAIAGLGIQIRDAAGNVRPEVFSEFTEQLGKLDRAQADATLAMIFGQDAFRAAAILGREGAAGLNAMREATQEAGVASELAGARTQGLAGAFENLKNQSEGLGLTIGNALKGPLTDFVNFTAEGIANINKFASFLADLGDQSEVTGESVREMFERVRETEELRGPEAAREVLREFGTEAQRTTQKFVDLITETGRVNRAVAARGTAAGEGLLRKQRELNEELENTQSASLRAASGIEDMRAAMAAAAAQSESLRNRLDESFDRFTQPLPEPTLAARGPRPIGPTARLESEAEIAAAQEDLQRLLRIRQQQFEQAQKAFENATNKNVRDRTALFNDMRAKEAAVINVRRQIQQARDAAEKAQTARENEAARTAAQNFLDAQANARQVQENAIARATQTAGFADDIRRQTELRALIQRQIVAVRASALDERTKQRAIQELTAAKIATTGTIKQLAATAAAERSAQRVAAAELNFSAQELLAQLTESDRDNERVLRAQIRFFAAEARRLGVATNAGKEMRIRALEFVVQLRELLKARAEAAGELEDAQQGTSVADLLRENARIFGQSAGNVIGGDQPFDSPAAFSSSLTRFLTPVSGKPQIEVVAKRDTATTAIDRQIQKLIDALNLNTNALTGGGPPGGKGVDVQVRRDRALKSFYESTVARDRLDARRSGI